MIRLPLFAARQHSLLILTTFLVLGMWLWLEIRLCGSRSHTHGAAVRQIEEMHADVNAIAQLRSAPQVAMERERPNDDLLREVREAMDRARVRADSWIGNDPNQPVRLPRTPYKRLSTRLSFAGITVQELVAMAFYLVDQNPALTVSALRLSTPDGDKGKSWNAELTVSYLIFSPFQQAAR